MIEIRPSFFAKVFSPFCKNEYLCLLNDYEIEFSSLDQDSKSSILAIKKIDQQEGLIWSRLSIKFESNPTLELTGLNKNTTDEIESFINKKKDFLKKIRKKIESFSDQIKKNGNWLKKAKNGLFWISESEKNEILENIKFCDEIFKLSFTKIPLDEEIIKSLILIEDFKKNPEGFKDSCNEIFIPKELVRFKEFFDRIESNPLTEEQRIAIVTDEDSTLVVASAGSGKTSLLVGKVSYLIKKGMANEGQILVLAFNRNAREEIIERLKSLKVECETHTFHSFGLKVSAKANKKKSSTATFIENNQLFFSFIQEKIEELFLDSKKFSEIKNFFISYLRPYQDKFNFNSLGEYYKFIKSNNLITLKGEYVKSMEELEISNFFFTNGISYEYEQNYEKETATSEKGQYKPDFFLTENKIYIEHFALNKNNETPDFIDQNQYLAGVEWKRKLHKHNKTFLLETYSYQKRDGNLTKILEDKLRSAGVVFKQMDPEELFSTLNKHGYINNFAIICGTFLNLFKGRDEGFNVLRNRLIQQKYDKNERILLFIGLFESLFEIYEEELKRLKEIDFHDMINVANQVILSNNCFTKFKYILVDEFQDISFVRTKLIDCLKKRER